MESTGHRDLLPMGFLKACGNPVAKILAVIVEASFMLEYFPKRFRDAGVVVLRKPGKKEETYCTAGGWRPIALLSTIGKVIEAAMAERITEMAEAHRLLPDGQV